MIIERERLVREAGIYSDLYFSPIRIKRRFFLGHKNTESYVLRMSLNPF